MPDKIMQVLEGSVLYFVLVFTAGFALGTMRTLWVISRVGQRKAELMETPIMLIVTIVAARWTVTRFALPYALSARLGMGCLALVLLISAEFGLVRFLRGMSIREYLATRDRVSGTAYYVMLVVFAIMPLLVARR